MTIRRALRSAAGIQTDVGFLSLGRFWGIPLRLHTSWLLVAGLLTWFVATRYLPGANSSWTAGSLWAAALLVSGLVSASVLLHEVGHALAAMRERVPVTGISLLSFGAATGIGRKPGTAGADFRIAIAGPLVSLLLAGLLAVWGAMVARDSVLGPALALLVTINLLLAASNLIPAFPLDGGRVLRALLWHLTGNQRRATQWASRSGQVFAVGLLVFGILLSLAGSLWAGVMFLVAALYLLNVAKTSLKQLRLRDLVAGVKARDVALLPCLPVPGALPLERAIAGRALDDDAHCFVVTEGDEAQGLILPEAAENAVLDGRDKLAVGKLMIPVEPGTVASADEDAWALLERMAGSEMSEIPVTDQGRLLGLLTREGLWQHINRHAQHAGAR